MDRPEDHLLLLVGELPVELLALERALEPGQGHLLPSPQVEASAERPPGLGVVSRAREAEAEHLPDAAELVLRELREAGSRLVRAARERAELPDRRQHLQPVELLERRLELIHLFFIHLECVGGIDLLLANGGQDHGRLLRRLRMLGELLPRPELYTGRRAHDALFVVAAPTRPKVSVLR